MSLQSIWVIGDWRQPDFEEPVAWLRTHFDCQFFESPLAIGADSRDSPYPQAIVFVQSRPGKFAADEVEMLHGSEPLARLIALTGPWCEGEQRSGKPVLGVTRVAWRNWRERLPMELALNVPMALMPRTAAETERVERMVKVASAAQAGRGKALICAARLETYNQIADAIQKLGLVIVTSAESSLSPDIIIYDSWEQASAFEKQLMGQNGQSRARRILLLHFPRPEDHVLAREAGIDAVLGQPLLLADLKSALSGTEKAAA